MARVHVPTSRRRLAVRKASRRERAPLWTPREHGAYLRIMWPPEGVESKRPPVAGSIGTETRRRSKNRAPSKREQVANAVETKTRTQVGSHHQKFENRVLEAVANGELREHDVGAYGAHRSPRFAGIVNRMATDDLFRGKMFDAIQDGANEKGVYLTRDAPRNVRLMEAIVDRLTPSVLRATLPPAHPLVQFAVERATSARLLASPDWNVGPDEVGREEILTNPQCDELLASDCEDSTWSDAGDTDDSGSIASSFSPVSSNIDDDWMTTERDESVCAWPPDRVSFDLDLA